MSNRESLKKAQQKYLSEKDQLILRVPESQKEEIVAHAKSMGESTNAFVARAVETAMEQEPITADKSPSSLTLRFPKGTRAKLNAYAQASGKTTTEFILNAISDAIKKDIPK